MFYMLLSCVLTLSQMFPTVFKPREICHLIKVTDRFRETNVSSSSANSPSRKQTHKQIFIFFLGETALSGIFNYFNLRVRLILEKRRLLRIIGLPGETGPTSECKVIREIKPTSVSSSSANSLYLTSVGRRTSSEKHRSI